MLLFFISGALMSLNDNEAAFLLFFMMQGYWLTNNLVIDGTDFTGKNLKRHGVGHP